MGYKSINKSDTCEDIDECSGFNNCQHQCENTQGSFHCTCKEGYQLASNGYDCVDINECQEMNGGCELGCINYIGSFQCYCEYGYQLYNVASCQDEIQCDLVDEGPI
ncbi:hypothetical protein LOD99_8379 [Oopsacas minuta]|uniref:EGF-like domain-containing protein n=1 Tax=Oopsacas minuta TaxID=111878 RepID=A0AAV7JGX0_9METZ|nr:hypothetical protein LOD99_8379 [Oopsacas minuta]